MTSAPNIGDRCTLKDDETASVFRVASIYLEGEVLFVSLELAKGGQRIHRAVAELRPEGGA